MPNWLYPQTVETISSPINGRIKVVKSRGKYSAWVGDFQQSGPLVEEIWSKALDNVTVEQCNKVLILGLGCGTVVKLLREKWPTAKITGIEIDPIMVNLGKKYFGLQKSKSLKIIISDATKFSQKNKQQFDLVLVDAYIGNQPKITKRTLAGLGRTVLINSLRGTKNVFVSGRSLIKSA